jgi:hypothetical protein
MLSTQVTWQKSGCGALRFKLPAVALVRRAQNTDGSGELLLGPILPPSKLASLRSYSQQAA